MEFQQVVERRRMVRNFETTPLDGKIVDRILSNALRAPSAGFSQGFEFLVLTGAADRERFWDVTWPEGRRGGERLDVMRAPLVIVPCSHKQAYLDRYAEPDKGWTDRDERRWPAPFWDIDTAFATMLMLLTVVDEGLGAVFFGVQQPEDVKLAFGIPPGFNPIGAIAVGRRAPDSPSPSLARGRRPLASVAHHGAW